MSFAAAPPPPDFNQFQFKTIGKEPDLLKRISTREPTFPYQYTPSPSPHPDPESAPATVLNRPTLFQALTHPSSNGRPPSPRRASRASSIDEDMQLQYPESDEPISPPFTRDYAALKDLHSRLDSMQAILALPPPPRPPRVAPPTLPQPSLIAATNAVHHSETLQTSAQELLQTLQARVSTSEQSFAAAQAMVYSLTQALSAAHTALDMAQKSLTDARKAADDARGIAISSRTTAEAIASTKHILDAPPPPRTPTPEPINPHAGIVGDMKPILNGIKLWVDQSEAGHVCPPSVSGEKRRQHIRETQVDQDEVPKVKLEEDAAQALVELSDLKTATHGQVLPRNEDHRHNNTQDPQVLALEREAALRQMQEVKREQVRIDKLQAHTAAAKSILKEREDAAEERNKSTATSSRPSSSRPSPTGAVAPPSSASDPKPKGKKMKVTSGGVKLSSEPSATSPEIERAAALGLRVRATSTKTQHSNASPPPPIRGDDTHLSSSFDTRTTPRSGAAAPSNATASKDNSVLLRATSTQKSSPSHPPLPPPKPQPSNKNKKVVPPTGTPSGPGTSKPVPGPSFVPKATPVSKAPIGQPVRNVKVPPPPPSPPLRRARTPDTYDARRDRRTSDHIHRPPSPSYLRPRMPSRSPPPSSSRNKQYSSWDHYSPDSTYPPLRDHSPPTAPRSLSNPQKRPHEAEFNQPAHSQKRFKNDAPLREEPRPTLELRLGAAPDAGGGHPQSDEFQSWGLLSRLSDPNPAFRARGGRGRGRVARGRGGRGRGGERSLADRMD